MIHLIGFSGVGKTTCAPILAELIKRPYIDLDEIVAKQADARQVNLFSEYGQDYYRNLESDVLEKIVEQSYDHILVTGGGTVIKEANRVLLAATGTVVHLTATPAIIADRITKSLYKHDVSRPLLNAIEMNKFLINILNFREVYYQAIAEISVNTDDMTPLEIANHIAAKLDHRFLTK